MLYATLLTGGIDSGAVIKVAVLAGLKVYVYICWLIMNMTKPRNWQTLAEELLAAVPESMRALGTVE